MQLQQNSYWNGHETSCYTTGCNKEFWEKSTKPYIGVDWTSASNALALAVNNTTTYNSNSVATDAAAELQNQPVSETENAVCEL